MKTIDDISISDLLPSSISDDQRVRNSAAAIDPELKRASGSLYLGANFANVDKLTSLQLDHLAYSFDLTTWRDSWPLNQKRQVAKTVVAQKCRMGTLSAIKKVLASLGSAVSITEWWEKNPRGEPHTFEVVASISSLSGGLSAESQEDFFRLLDEAKPVRSHYTFTVVQSLLGQIHISAAIRPVSYARCISEQLPITGQIIVGGVFRPATYTRI